MSLRLERAIDEVNRIERKIMMYQNQKKEASARLKLIENEEIIRSIRTLNLKRDELVELLKGLQDGTVTFSDVKENADTKDDIVAAKEMDGMSDEVINNAIDSTEELSQSVE